VVAVKRKGIVARPGVHRNVITGKDEVITWEELREAVQFQNRIPLVLSHPLTGHINPDERIGTVTQRVNDKEKVIEGEFWFFDEPKYWGQIPPELKRKIIGGQPINLSAGYKVGAIIDGRQTSRQYDHIALDVKSPMFNVGITEGDVRMESKLPDNFRIEETPTIVGTENNTTDAAKKTVPMTEPYDPIGLAVMIGELKAEVASLKEQLAAKPVAEETVKETRPEPEAEPEPAPPKPKTVVPQGAASKKDAPDEDGVFRIVG
jgi:hypothetical protein